MIFQMLKTLGYNVPDEVRNYYSYIDVWNCWWKGYVDDFHRYALKAEGKAPVWLKRKQMRMAKKVCEDWASLLLNDKTRIIVDGEDTDGVNPTQVYLTGDENEQSGGVFGRSKFWKKGNRAVEREFAQGTVCFYLCLDKPRLENGVNLRAEDIRIKVIKDAQKIIPLTYDDESISEIAIASNFTKQGTTYTYLQIFQEDINGSYLVINKYFELDKSGSGFHEVPSPNGEVESYKMPCKPFVVMKPNIENNISDVPLGMSIYANAIDMLESCDLAYDNMFADTLLGKKRVFMNQAAVTMTSVTSVDNDGNTVQYTEPNVTASLEKALYVVTSEKMPDENQFFQEYNPSLRVDENKTNVQFNLNLLSSKVGLGQRRYSFDAQNMATATEVKVSNKDLTESVWKQRIEIEEALTELTKSILIIAKEKCGANVDPEAKITIQFDDTMFSDEESERMRFLQEISQGVRKPYEYRVKYLGEDEETAKSVTGEDKPQESMEKKFFGGVN